MSTYYGSSMHQAEHSRIRIIRFRVLAAAPPVVLAALATNLGVITDYAGVTGFLIALVFPALLSLSSKYRMIRMGLPAKTHYTSIMTSTPCAILVLFCGIALTVFVLYNLIENGS